MIRRRDILWVEMHSGTTHLRGRKLKFVDLGNGVPVTYSSPDHHHIALGTVRDLVAYKGYIDANGKLLPSHSGPDSIGEHIRQYPQRHQVRPVWDIDFDADGQPIIVIREITVEKVAFQVGQIEVHVTRAGGERPSPYTRSVTATSHAATGHARVAYT